MANTTISSDTLMRAIERAVREDIYRITEEETVAAQQRIAKRINARADKLALDILARYNLADRENELVITVKKAEVPK